MSALDDLVAAVATQTAAIDAELADPTARLRSASLSMKLAAATAQGFDAKGTITHVSGNQLTIEMFDGVAAIAASDVLVSKASFLASSLDTGTATVSAVNDPSGVVVTVTAGGGWSGTEGHVVGKSI